MLFSKLVQDWVVLHRAWPYSIYTGGVTGVCWANNVELASQLQFNNHVYYTPSKAKIWTTTKDDKREGAAGFYKTPKQQKGPLYEEKTGRQKHHMYYRHSERTRTGA